MSARQFPKTYLEFEGRKVVDGKRRQFWIQDATEDMFQEIEDQLLGHFIGDEPTTRYLKCKDDPISLEEFRVMWQKILQEKYTIVCMTKDDEGNVKLAGFNALTESKADEKDDYNFKGQCTKSLIKILKYCEDQRKFHEEFKLARVMKAMGLFVLPEYRGEGLGERILDARELLCKNVGIAASLTAFSSVISQKLAARVGFKEYYTIEYEELGKIDPEMHIPDIHNHSKYMKYMYKMYN